MVLKTEAIVTRGLHAIPTLESICLDDLRPDEALVEIHASGICHTDIACMNGTIPSEFPAVFGHEGQPDFPVSGFQQYSCLA